MTKDTLDITAARPERNRADANMERITAAADEVVAGIRANAVTLHKAELAQNLALMQGMGMFRAFDIMNQFTGLARLKWLAERKESGDYKKASVLQKDGSVKVLKTFDDLCEYVGTSSSKVYEDLRNLHMLGENFMVTAEALGLGYRELRRLRAGIGQLPEGEREKVLEEINSVQGQDEAVEKLEEVRTRLAEAELKVKELSATMEAKERVSKEKSEKLEDMEVRIQRLTSIHPDDQRALSEEVQDKAREAVDTACRKLHLAATGLIGQCFAVLTDDRATAVTRAWTQERVGMTFAEIANGLMASGLDVDLAQLLTPITVGIPDEDMENPNLEAE